MFIDMKQANYNGARILPNRKIAWYAQISGIAPKFVCKIYIYIFLDLRSSAQKSQNKTTYNAPD